MTKFNSPNSGNRSKNCKYITNLRKYSKRYEYNPDAYNRYWYCDITPSNRTSYGVKKVKRMNPACEKFEKK